MNDTARRQFPLVSILMPSFNQAEYIVQSLESIALQGYPALEVLVIDGGSSDDTIKEVSAFQRSHPWVQLLSEPDEGPAHALNKGLRIAKGSVIGWLNSDDLYCEQAVFHALAALMGPGELLMVYGRGEHIDAAGRVINEYPTIPPSQVSVDSSLGCFVCQPTVFFKHTMAVLLGEFNQQLKTAFDFDYWMRAFERFPSRIGYCDQLIAQSRLHDGCITRTQRRQVIRESMAVVARYAGQVSGRWLSTYQHEVSPGIASPAERQADFEELLNQFQAWIDPAHLAEFQKNVVAT